MRKYRSGFALTCRAQSSGERAFTLIELLVVAGLVATLSFFLLTGLGNKRSAALRAGQTLLANFIHAARTEAFASGERCRVLVNVDVASAHVPARYLRYLVLQVDTGSGWQILAEVFLPEGVYVVPGNFDVIPSGLLSAASSAPWKKGDNSDLRSTALRSNQIVSETINNTVAEKWVGILLSAAGGTVQSGDLILATGHPRAPGSYAEGDSPVELENAEQVRGLTLSSYGVPALINARTSF